MASVEATPLAPLGRRTQRWHRLYTHTRPAPRWGAPHVPHRHSARSARRAVGQWGLL